MKGTHVQWVSGFEQGKGFKVLKALKVLKVLKAPMLIGGIESGELKWLMLIE